MMPLLVMRLGVWNGTVWCLECRGTVAKRRAWLRHALWSEEANEATVNDWYGAMGSINQGFQYGNSVGWSAEASGFGDCNGVTQL